VAPKHIRGPHPPRQASCHSQGLTLTDFKSPKRLKASSRSISVTHQPKKPTYTHLQHGKMGGLQMNRGELLGKKPRSCRHTASECVKLNCDQTQSSCTMGSRQAPLGDIHNPLPAMHALSERIQFGQ